MQLFSQSLSIVLWCEGELLNVTFSFSSARCIRWPSFALITVSCCCIIDVMLLGYLCCTRFIQTWITVCSLCFDLLLPEFVISELWPQLIHWSLRCQDVECPNLQGVSLKPKIRNNLPYTVFDTGMLDGLKWAVNHWLLPWVVFS